MRRSINNLACAGLVLVGAAVLYAEPPPTPAVIQSTTTPQESSAAGSLSRIEHLEAAAKHLEAAGLNKEAEHLRKEIEQWRSDSQQEMAAVNERLAEINQERLALEQQLSALKAELGLVDTLFAEVSIIKIPRAELASILDCEPEELGRPSAFNISDRQQASIDQLIESNSASRLSEPTVAMQIDRPATVQSGGEFPILLPNPANGDTTAIEFRRFGTMMELLPSQHGASKIELAVMLEHSARDYANSVANESGIAIPSLNVSRMQTKLISDWNEPVAVVTPAQFEEPEPTRVDDPFAIGSAPSKPEYVLMGIITLSRGNPELISPQPVGSPPAIAPEAVRDVAPPRPINRPALTF